jgi:gliding motility-associated-like protein
VTVICDQGNLFIPNAFTPNGDRLNERFYIKGQGIQEIRSFRIFNRWGTLLFEKGGVKINDPSYGWDGTFKGIQQPEGVYSYSVELVCSNGLLVPIKGIVTLIR